MTFGLGALGAGPVGGAFLRVTLPDPLAVETSSATCSHPKHRVADKRFIARSGDQLSVGVSSRRLSALR